MKDNHRDGRKPLKIHPPKPEPEQPRMPGPKWVGPPETEVWPEGTPRKK